MIYLIILLSLAEASIVIPLRKQPNFSSENHPFSLRGLSYSSSITNYWNYQYYIQTSIGTPPQSFSMLLSLKTPWIFIDQKNCTQCRISKKFDNSTSSTFENEGKYLIFNSVGPFAGYTGYDTVNIAGIDAKSQGIILVSKESEKENLVPDGIVGLGFITASDGTFSILSTLYSQHSIDHMVFSIYLNDHNISSDLPNYGESMLIIDGHDIDKYAAESNFTYIKAANSDGFWQMDFDNAIFDKINITSGYKAIISPGTSFIQGPKDDIDQILKRLRDNYPCEDGSDGQLYCDCIGNYPDLIIHITGVKFRIKSVGYLTKFDDDYCIQTFEYSKIANTWVLGDAFMRRFYTLFDMENMKIGFATVGKKSHISSSDSEESSSSFDKDWKIQLALSLSGLAVFIAWIFSLFFLYIKMRESRAMRETKKQEKNQRFQNGFDEEKRLAQEASCQNIANAEQRSLEIKLKDDIANDGLKILEERTLGSEIAEKMQQEAESNSNFITPYGIAPFKEESCYPAFQAFQKCCICEKDSEAIRGLLCGHYVCEEDLRNFLENNIEDNYIERAIRCPYGNCSGNIGSFIIQSLVSQTSWEKLNSYAKSKNLELNTYE